MKVFISWSGDLSKKIAEEFSGWLQSVIQTVDPYFTPEDIEKGSMWSSEIARNLDESEVGVLCLTPKNLDSEWMLFEGGALTRKLGESRVCPLLFEVSSKDLPLPLQQFQATEFNKGDIYKLLTTINEANEGTGLNEQVLEKNFEKWWPDLEDEINEIISEFETETEQPRKEDRELLEEILDLTRTTAKRVMQKETKRETINPKATADLISHLVDLHRGIQDRATYEELIAIFGKLEKVVNYLYKVSASEPDSNIEELYDKFKDLEFRLGEPPGDEGEEEIPF